MTTRNPEGRGVVIEAPATFVDRVGPDGVIVRWESRHHRKHQKPAVGSTWWAPKARGWWIAILFAIGSLLFAIGSVPGYASAAGAVGDTVTYFVGSLFFTAASFLSYREAVDAAPGDLNPAHRRFFVYQPGRIDWWATGVQLVGTLYFNVSTGLAMVTDLSAQAAHQHVWRPDAIGSVCFLVSSALAWYEVCHGWAAWRPRSYSWWITVVNLIGSIAFGISAVAGYINPVTGQVHNAGRANAQTLIGAVCFLIGAVLLLPERTEPVSGQVMTRAADALSSADANKISRRSGEANAPKLDRCASPHSSTRNPDVGVVARSAAIGSAAPRKNVNGDTSIRPCRHCHGH